MNRKILLPLILLLAIIATATLYLRFGTVGLNVVSLMAPYEVYYGGDRYENINPEAISDWLDTPFKEGEVIRLEKTLPTSPSADDNCLLLRTNYCDVTVYLNGEEIGATDPVPDDRMTGDDLFFVSLPGDCSGQKLAIEYTVRESGLVRSFATPRLGPTVLVAEQYIRQDALALVGGAFLLITGFLFLFVSVFFAFLAPSMTGQMVSSVICIVMGISSLTNYHMGSLTLGLPHESFLSYLSLYLMIPLMFFLVRRVYRLRFPTFFLILAIVSAALFILVTVLSTVGPFHICDFWLPYQIVAFLTIVTVIVADISVRRTSHIGLQDSVQMAGPTVFGVFSLLSNAVYILPALQPETSRTISLYLLTGGMLVFAVSRFFLYLVYVRESLGRRREFSALSSLAYVDKMTGLPNRTKCDEKFFELDKGTLDYCIVSLDLNGLKYVNDHFGHDAGDRLLRGFAAVMNASFGNAGLCCRMGGDEFLVVFDRIAEKQVHDRLNHMQMLLVKLDEQEPIVRHSCAYGVAWKHELPDGDAHDVYMLADQRMYDRKQEQYKTLGIARRSS